MQTIVYRPKLEAPRREVVPALYLADTVTTATAEWYRSLAEWGLSPQNHMPYDHHRWRLDLELADLSDVERLHACHAAGSSTEPEHLAGLSTCW